MKRNRFSEEQIIKILKEYEAGVACTKRTRRYAGIAGMTLSIAAITILLGAALGYAAFFVAANTGVDTSFH